MKNKLRKISQRLDEFEESIYKCPKKICAAATITVLIMLAASYVLAALKYGVQ